jgi:DnaK suppressor protein
MRDRLLAKLAENTARLRGKDLHLEHDSDAVVAMVSAYDRELDISEVNRLTVENRLIHSALERLDAGDFGICLDCGEPISQRRLAVLPWALLCRDCQEAADRRAAEGGEVAA